MKVLITGAKGMLGGELCQQLAAEKVFAYDVEDLDISKSGDVQETVNRLQPDCIINCAAYNNVEKAEEQEALAMSINCQGPENLAKSAQSIGAVLVHFSTGYVFDGEQHSGYNESAQPNPQSAYAKSKYAGEQAVSSICSNHYIIRLNFLFGSGGTSVMTKKSFPDQVLDWVATKNELELVADEVSTPTYVKDLAQATLSLLRGKYPYGVYHLSNEGQASYYDWAKEILRIKKLNNIAIPINREKLLSKAIYPKCSVLLNTKFPKLRDWQSALEEYLNKKL